jgi:hypothetical protein
MLLIIVYLILIACGGGFRYYRWWDAKNPDASWKAHLLQWWWAFLGMTTIYCMRFMEYDTIFRAIGEYFGVCGASIVGYTIMHAILTKS